MKTEGYFITKVGNASDAFALKEFVIPELQDQEVTVEVEAFGLNYADVMARRGLYREAPPFPCIVGYEVVGKVVAIGPNANPDILNKRVIAFCRFGGYARHVVTNDYAVVEAEKGEAAELLALCTQAVTAYYMAEYLTPVHPGDNVLIHAAAGGVGTILIQLAKLKGATVFAKVGNDEKALLAKELGADHTINYRSEDYVLAVSAILKEDRLDISFNPVAGSTYKKDMHLLGSGGRMVLFGGSQLSDGKWGIFSKLNFVRKMGVFLPIALMMKSKNVLGVNMLKIADNKPAVLEVCLKKVVELYHEGKLKPQVGGSFSHDQLSQAHDLLESGNSTGKLSVYWDVA